MVATRGAVHAVYDAFASVDWTVSKISSIVLLLVGLVVAEPLASLYSIFIGGILPLVHHIL